MHAFILCFTRSRVSQPRSGSVEEHGEQAGEPQPASQQHPRGGSHAQHVDEHVAHGQGVDPGAGATVVAHERLGHGAERDPHGVVQPEIQAEHSQHRPSPPVGLDLDGTCSSTRWVSFVRVGIAILSGFHVRALVEQLRALAVASCIRQHARAAQLNKPA